MAHPTTNGHGNGAAGKIRWQQTPEGKARLSAAMKRHRAEHPHSTRPVTAAKIAKAKQLMEEGKPLVEISKQVKMSVSSVKRHAAPLATPFRTKGGGSSIRIPEPTKRRIRKLLAKGVPPMEVAKRTKVHQSSVYHQRSLMKAASDESGNESESQSESESDHTASALPPLMTMAGFRQAKKYNYDCVRRDNNREFSRAELKWLLTYEQMLEAAGE